MSKNQNLYIIVATVVITVILVSIFHDNLSNHDATDEIAIERLQDSVTISDGTKVSGVEFEDVYSEYSWYANFTRNKAAFDQNYKNAKIDIHGVIKNISHKYDCSTIVMHPGSGPFRTITFSNCPAGRDKFAKEVIQTNVGDTVHIKGIYDASISTDSEMVLVGCNIVK